MHVHHLVVRREVLRLLLGDLGPELGNRHLRRAVDDRGLREDVVGVELDGLGREPLDLVVGRVLRVGPVRAAVRQGQVDGPGLLVDDQPAACGDQELRLVGVPPVGYEDVAPAGAVAGDVPRVERQVRKVLEEDPRLDLGGDTGGDDFGEQRLVVLVASRHRPDHHVAGRQTGRHGTGGDGP